MSHWVYEFGDGKAEGAADMAALLGGKGANLAEMCNLGLPVPPGFTITTEVCAHFIDTDGNYPDGLGTEVLTGLYGVERIINSTYGDRENPLLLSIRSGARASMPGMMDTVLNLGLNDATVEGLAAQSGDARFAYDSYRRFIQMYGDVVLGVDHHHFEAILEVHKEARGVALDTELGADDLNHLISEYKKKIEEELGEPFPQDVSEQLWGAIGAVFKSWGNRRAVTYRRLHAIPDDWGTAVSVQSMVFGNRGETSATGVCFTRNPSTGENNFYGEYLVNAQGEDVVAGIRTPQPLTIAEKESGYSGLPAMEESMPEAYAALVVVRDKLERHYTDMQDLEFTVEEGRLWVLQTRTGKRTANAALKIACDMVAEELIGPKDAVLRIEPDQLDHLLHPMIDPNAARDIIAHGLPASPGAASGKMVFTAEDAETRVKQGETVILVRSETSPEDIAGMHAAEGILTARGGMTSHAAVVARGMGTPCVAGAGDIRVNVTDKTMKVLGEVFSEGDVITLDGGSGEVLRGKMPMVDPELSGDFSKLMGWADEFRRLGVRANAETPIDAKAARFFGAEGIGLSRTEHMFFQPERIIYMREMIVAKTETQRRIALAKLLPYQRDDFVQLFRIMEGLPVTIRLLDPPLHEFIPHTDKEMEEVAKSADVSFDDVRDRATSLYEQNPMMGHRGARLAITYPEIAQMQARAIFEAAAILIKEGITVEPEVMVPLIALQRAFAIIKDQIDRVAGEVMTETGVEIVYTVGTMIELPRAALRAGEIAELAEFFSFGTNDLTQSTFGLSRDDAGSFIHDYIEKGIMPADPFQTLDVDGVGELIKIAIERGRATRPDIKLGICGEHGGDPASIRFCEAVGLDYVSCSPYRVPIARLAAAQAALGDGGSRTA